MKNKILFILLFCIVSCLFFSCKKNPIKEIIEARQSDEKSVVVINHTYSKYITECKLTTEIGEPIGYKKDVEEETIIFSEFDQKHVFENESSLKIVMIDRHKIKYEKFFTVNAKGVTTVEITEKDYVKQKKDFWKKLERWFNN